MICDSAEVTPGFALYWSIGREYNPTVDQILFVGHPPQDVDISNGDNAAGGEEAAHD